jgi:hypothetical protein
LGSTSRRICIVIVRHDEVTGTIHAASPQISTVRVEFSEIRASKALDEVLLDSASGGNEARDVLVLHKVQNNFAEARRYEIGGVAEKDVAARSSTNVRVGEFVRFIGGDWFTCMQDHDISISGGQAGQDGRSHRHARRTCFSLCDVADVHGVSRRMGFNSAHYKSGFKKTFDYSDSKYIDGAIRPQLPLALVCLHRTAMATFTPTPWTPYMIFKSGAIQQHKFYRKISTS